MNKFKLGSIITVLLIFLTALHSPVEAQRSAQSVQGLFDEPLRPQFHFTPKINWMNDPNGLVYYNGVWHMFFQHNPEGINWGNMTWGHATSPDLIHWTHKDHKLWPDELGTIWSGSAVVDYQNTAGFQTGDDPVIVAIYTYAGHEADPPKEFTQGIAYSLDGGETFIKYEGNPVMGNMSGGRDRDPKVFWHDDSEQWVMVIYLGEGHRFAVYTSPNLKDWTETQILEDEFYEVPDLFELPVDDDPDNTKWVFVDVFGDYLLGTFDGERFERTSGRHKGEYGDNFYATQTWDNSPDGRLIQIAWMRGGQFPGMPFNQQMSFPAELSLQTTENGVRLFRTPIQEIELLHDETISFNNVDLQVGENILEDLEGDIFDIRIEFEMRDASVLGLGVGGNFPNYNATVEYYSSDETLLVRPDASGVRNKKSTAPLASENGTLKLQILIDRTSIEVFGNDGVISMTNNYSRSGDDARSIGLTLFTREGSVKIQSLDIHKLKSAWNYEKNR